MYDTAERVRLVQLRALEIRRKRESRQITGLGFLSSLLIFAIFGATNTLSGGLHGGTVSGLSGTMLLYENAGGYVLAAVLSFAAAVVITVLCIKHRENAGKG